MNDVKSTSSLCLLGFAALMACGGGDKNPEPGTDGGNPDDDAGPPGPPAPYCTPKSGTTLKLTEIAWNPGAPGFVALQQPVFVTSPPNDGRLFVLERTGAIRVIKNGVLLEAPFITIATNFGGTENGLLGLAFHPQYAQNGKFYVHYVIPGSSNSIRIAQYTATPTADVVSNRTEKVILETAHPYDGHNGGTVAFGPDGFLYISIGDGGGANDDLRNGQNRATVLAKILRIDVDGGDPYAIPPTNPWANTNDAKETYAWGFRNPYRFTIDRNGDLWIGDVGQARVEELNVARAGSSGQNFGWSVFEGEECFMAKQRPGDCDRLQDSVEPVTFRMRGASASILAGPVYRGGCMTDMAGRVFFGDYALGEVRSFPASQSKVAYDNTTSHSADLDTDALLQGRFSSFGTDAFGEIYVVAMRNTSSGSTPGPGHIYRIEVE
jgi:glucose/arabinose dehydrogenase